MFKQYAGRKVERTYLDRDCRPFCPSRLAIDLQELHSLHCTCPLLLLPFTSHDQSTTRLTPSKKMAMMRKVQPLASLNPYQATWKIKVLLTGKGSMHTFKNRRGEGCVFNVELTDEDGTQMQATIVIYRSSRKKSFVVCLWNDQATYLGQELLDMVDKSPIVAIKSLKVGDFRGFSLSTLPNSYIRINPDISQCLKLRSW
ncbi:Nucleic acid-binding, OB-fold, partial [Cynara cardunculus var. scolymus]